MFIPAFLFVATLSLGILHVLGYITIPPIVIAIVVIVTLFSAINYSFRK